VLRIEGLDVAYGGLHALSGLSLGVQAGQFVAIVGPNGAGKTTLFKAVSGIVRPRAGRILFEDADLLAMPPAERAHLGIAHVPEGRQVFRTLSVMENLEMGALPRRGRADWSRNLEQIFTLFPILKERTGQAAGTLSGGEQQMVAIARALMASPRLLLLDETSLGLAPIVVDEIFVAVRRLAAQGLTILVVEQNTALALEVADHGYVLEQGHFAIQGAASSLAADPRVKQAYLGI